jgi:hypothetical protein
MPPAGQTKLISEFMPADATNAAINWRGLRRAPLTAHQSKLQRFPCVPEEARGSFWPITSLSQFGPRPLLAEPDIAICRLLLAVDHGTSGGPW